jgi:hypothetical protein
LLDLFKPVPPPPRPIPPPPAPEAYDGYRINRVEPLLTIAGRISRETESLKSSGKEKESIDKARENLAHMRFNALERFGPDVQKRSKMADPRRDESQRSSFASSLEAARRAFVDHYFRGIDPTRGAIFANQRPNESAEPFQGRTQKTHSGPFSNKFPTKELPRGKGVYVNTYR